MVDGLLMVNDWYWRTNGLLLGELVAIGGWLAAIISCELMDIDTWWLFNNGLLIVKNGLNDGSLIVKYSE